MKRVLFAAIITIISILAPAAFASGSPARPKPAVLDKKFLDALDASTKWHEPAFKRDLTAIAEAFVRQANAEHIRSAGKKPVAALADELRLREVDVIRLQTKPLPQSLAAYEERDLFRVTKGRVTQAVEQNVDAYAAAAGSVEHGAAAREALTRLGRELSPEELALLTRTAGAHAVASGAERVALHRARKNARKILGAAGAVLTMLSVRDALAEEQVAPAAFAQPAPSGGEPSVLSRSVTTRGWAETPVERLLRETFSIEAAIGEVIIAPVLELLLAVAIALAAAARA